MTRMRKQSEIVIAWNKLTLANEITETRFLVLSCLALKFNEFISIEYLSKNNDVFAYIYHINQGDKK